MAEVKEVKKYEYELGGKKYIQRKCVWAQHKQLIDLLEDVKFPQIPIGEFQTTEEEYRHYYDWVKAVGGKISQFLAIVLIAEDEDFAERFRASSNGSFGYESDAGIMSEIARHISIHIDSEDIMEVVADFFGCNPISSLSGKVIGMIKGLKKNLPAETQENPQGQLTK